ncbi:hypothetical protein I8D64_04115 [Brachybacterium sp. MASK1Z-5]|uniref:Secreted protein n=1 Tax=Brachybacterium halotolerans TaxID=2795215 RepID=A0ABS1B8R4_9MICO|nr:hypothetical protein [Brachybacterium halotolerans]MBK0330582.1 hypothetical protein [Brachybacterium halotolerans]
MRRILCLCAASSLLALGLVACGSDSEVGSPTTAESTPEDSADEDSPSDKTTDSESNDTASDDTDGSDENDGSGPSTAGSTSIDTLWIDSSWSIEDVDEDLCATGGKTRSPYAQDDDMFICGPTAAGAEACDMAEGETVAMCITDPVGHRAIRFDSPTAAEGSMDQGDGDLIPLFVLLDDGSENGIQCATVAHDQEKHWHGKFSWYRCDDGSELLTDELIEETFDRGDDGSTWTVLRSVDTKAPEETPVTDAVFAGN